MKENTNTASPKYYIRLETDEEGIRQYKETSAKNKIGTELCQMRVDGKLVPAIKMEVDKKTYDEFQRESWRAEDRYKQENRCIICGSNGKSMRCPMRVPNPKYTPSNGQTKTLSNDCTNCPYGYHHLFKPLNGKIYFSSLDLIDDNGNVDEFDPTCPGNITEANIYFTMLQDLIQFISEKYPNQSSYIELISLLGNKIDLKEAATLMNRSKSTLYGWLKKLRPMIDEYLNENAL